MNTFIVDANIEQSADLLDQRRLFSSVYEGIHGLASLLNVSDKLVNPKKPKANHPCAKQYVDYTVFWYRVLKTYYDVWWEKFANKEKYTKDGTINAQNLKMLAKVIEGNATTNIWFTPKFFNIYMVRMHRNVLYWKDPIFYSNWYTEDVIPMQYFSWDLHKFVLP